MTKTPAVDSSRKNKASVERSNRGVTRDPSSKQAVMMQKKSAKETRKETGTHPRTDAGGQPAVKEDASRVRRQHTKDRSTLTKQS
jgi:hypothetical protein